jgi:hypothetical protein
MIKKQQFIRPEIDKFRFSGLFLFRDLLGNRRVIRTIIKVMKERYPIFVPFLYNEKNIQII